MLKESLEEERCRPKDLDGPDTNGTIKAMSKAKVFANGRSQAVRLPVEFRVEVEELYIRRDADSGDLILSTRPNNWDHIEALLDKGADPNGDGFMEDRSTEPAPEPNLF